MRTATRLMVLAVIASSPVWSSADEPPTATERPRDGERFAALTERVPEYTFKPAGSAEPFELVPQPVLKWTNPVRGTGASAVYLWTDQGRAAACMCAFWRDEREYKHEFQSLSDGPFEAKLGGQAVWTPEAGVTAKPHPSGPAVAKSRRLRLAQMRRIAQEYKAYVGNEDGTRTELRLLPQPLYRYAEEPGAPGVIDGAVFAHVQATDPEVLMVLEAHSRPNGKAEWRVAFARMSRWPQSVQRDGEEVWSFDWTAGSKDDPYVVLSYVGGDRP